MPLIFQLSPVLTTQLLKHAHCVEVLLQCKLSLGGRPLMPMHNHNPGHPIVNEIVSFAQST